MSLSSWILILTNPDFFDEKIGSLNVRPPWKFYFLTVRGGKMSVNFKWCHIVEIANIVKCYFCTAAERHEAKDLSLSSFLRNKKIFNSLLLHPVTAPYFPPLCFRDVNIVPSLDCYSLSSSIQAAVVKLGRLVHPRRLCAQSGLICKKNL